MVTVYCRDFFFNVQNVFSSPQIYGISSSPGLWLVFIRKSDLVQGSAAMQVRLGGGFLSREKKKGGGEDRK